jgi:hypothetical protein
VELKPRVEHVVYGQVVGGNLRSSPTLVCVEPAVIPIQSICMARVLTYTRVAGSERSSGRKHLLQSRVRGSRPTLHVQC